jgi:hypothetical protein
MVEYQLIDQLRDLGLGLAVKGGADARKKPGGETSRTLPPKEARQERRKMSLERPRESPSADEDGSSALGNLIFMGIDSR